MFKDTHAFCKTCGNCQKVDTGKNVLLVKHVYPYRACDIENPNNDNLFKVNGHRLKAYFDNFPSENESIGLNDPID